MTHTYSAVPLPKATMEALSPFTSIIDDIDEEALKVFDEILVENGDFNVFQTYFTDPESKERMVRNNAFSHDGPLVDYRAYITWNQTIHLRYHNILKGLHSSRSQKQHGEGATSRNPFLCPSVYHGIRQALKRGVKPRKLADCNYAIEQGCVMNLDM